MGQPVTRERPLFGARARTCWPGCVQAKVGWEIQRKSA